MKLNYALTYIFFRKQAHNTEKFLSYVVVGTGPKIVTSPGR